MQLPGRLSATTLGDLLGTLYRARATGVLELVEQSGALAGRTHRIRLRAGLVAQVESPLEVPRLGDILQDEGFLDDAAARRLTQRLLSLPHRPTGSILLEDGLCSDQALSAALRQQLRTRLDALFSLGEARVSFHVACPASGRADTSIPLSPVETLRGRARKRQRQSRNESLQGGCHPVERERGPRRSDPARAQALRVLGLGSGADRQAVQRAFRQLAAEFHPDRHPRATASERAQLMRRFAELSAAYHELVA